MTSRLRLAPPVAGVIAGLADEDGVTQERIDLAPREGRANLGPPGPDDLHVALFGPRPAAVPTDTPRPTVAASRGMKALPRRQDRTAPVMGPALGRVAFLAFPGGWMG